MAGPAGKNSTNAVITTGAIVAPSDTAIGDVILFFVWSQGTDNTTLTHTLQSGFTQVRTHGHDDGTTDGRLSVAVKVVTVAGAQSYTPYVIANATASQTAGACIVYTNVDTTAPGSWIQASITATGNQPPDPPSITGLNGDLEVVAASAWHITTAAATAVTAPSGYFESIDGPTGTHVTHLGVGVAGSTGLVNATIDPAAWADNVTPNGTCSITFAMPGIPVPALSTLSPSSATVGGILFTLTVNGSNFLSSAIVQWNGADRTTTFVNSTQLTASIPATDIASIGTASVTVRNFSVVSNVLTFTITAVSQINTRQRRASVIGLDVACHLVLPAPNTSVTGWDRAQLVGKYMAFTTDGVASAVGNPWHFYRQMRSA